MNYLSFFDARYFESQGKQVNNEQKVEGLSNTLGRLSISKELIFKDIL